MEIPSNSNEFLDFLASERERLIHKKDGKELKSLVGGDAEVARQYFEPLLATFYNPQLNVKAKNGLISFLQDCIMALPSPSQCNYY